MRSRILRQHARRRKPLRRSPASPHAAAGWEGVALWYREHLREEGSLLRSVVYPRALRLLAPVRGKQYLDIACGEGTFAAMVAARGADVMGVDAAPSLIRAAERKRIARAKFLVADARACAPRVGAEPFAGATCLLAIANIEPFVSVFTEAAVALAPGAPFVLVLAHPCFRIPRQSGWGWDEARGLQYRRVDRYATPLAIPVAVRPGVAPGAVTTTYHRPLAAYVAALAEAGFVIAAIEEWASDRVSDRGSRQRAEDRSRAEIPVFLAIRAERR